MESILSSPCSSVAMTTRLEPYLTPHSQSSHSETHIRSGYSPVSKLVMLSVSYLVKARPLSMVQQALHRLTPPFSNLTRPELVTLYAPYSLHLFSLCPENSYSILQVPIQTLSPFQSIS